MEKKTLLLKNPWYVESDFVKLQNLNWIYDDLSLAKSLLEEINLSRGVVLTSNIFDSKEYPIISLVAAELMTEAYWNGLNNYKKVSIYKWLGTLYLLKFTNYTYKCLNAIEAVNREGLKMLELFSLNDTYSKFKILNNWGYSMLDNSIKQHLIKRGITVTGEIYTGFDTEYNPIDFGECKLITAQLSISSGLKMNIPIRQEFKFEGVNTLTAETYLKSEPPFSNIEFVKWFIENQIREIRALRFGDHDIKMNQICNHFFSNHEGIDTIKDTETGFIFQFKKSPIHNVYIIPKEGEDLELKFETLVSIINNKVSVEEAKQDLNYWIKSLDYKNLGTDLIPYYKESKPWDGNTLPELKETNLILSNSDNASKKKNFKLYKESKKELSEITFVAGTEGSFIPNYLSKIKSKISNSKTVNDLIDGKITTKIAIKRLLEEGSTYSSSSSTPALDVINYLIQELKNWKLSTRWENITPIAINKRVAEVIYYLEGRASKIRMIAGIDAGQIKLEGKGVWTLDEWKRVWNEKEVAEERDGAKFFGKNSLQKKNSLQEKELEEEEVKSIFKICSANLRDSSIPISFKTFNYLCAHYNAADLGMLQDWKEISRQNIDVLKKSFSSLAYSLKSLGHNVFIRDTLLLSSAAASTLEAVGKSHGLQKLVLPSWVNRNDMAAFYLKDPKLFRQYAMTDSLITLIHALFMNDFAFRLGGLRLPNTLGSLSARYIKNKWNQDGYRGYQIDQDFLLGDAQTSHTPKGISSLGFTGEVSNMFLASYRGGRNESFKYGTDLNTKWYDYDLASCYSTIMSMCGDLAYEDLERELQDIAPNILPMVGQPDYSKGLYINTNNLRDLDFKQSYSALKVKFVLPPSIVYPPIPVQLDKNITIYPLEGVSVITGLEYLAAINILNKELAVLRSHGQHVEGKYYIKVLAGAYIPFKKDPESGELIYPPFYDVIRELQANRRKHPKKSSLERIYKDLGNMLYGKVVCGISNKRSFDSRTLAMKSMVGNEIANPIIGAWITGFVRALLAELLHQVSLLGGKVCSVTTDGFVTNIPDLENVLLNFNKENNIQNSFLQAYRDTREKLSGNPEALEVKTSVRGLMQWTTRGQLSLDPSEKVGIAAMTGFQRFQFSQSENIGFVKGTLQKGNKLLFLQKRLSGALDLYKDNKQVSMESSLRRFRTIFDSKRKVVTMDPLMYDTVPFVNVSEALLDRNLMFRFKTSIYSDKYRNVIVPSSPNIMHETIKYFLRVVSENWNWKLTSSDKKYWVDFINFNLVPNSRGKATPYSESFLLDVFNSIEQNRGTILNQLGVFGNNIAFIKKLYSSLKKHLPVFACKFVKVFSNFFD